MYAVFVVCLQSNAVSNQVLIDLIEAYFESSRQVTISASSIYSIFK